MSNIVVDFVVIGSGPSGWAALHALVASGKKPLLIDIGFNNEKNHVATNAVINEQIDFSLKSRHGSTYMYEYPTNIIDAGNLKGKIPLSGAFGGLSTVWGTNLQLCRDACIKSNDGSDHEYNIATKTVLNNMFNSGALDDLNSVGFWPIPFSDSTPQSKRMEQIQVDLRRAFNAQPFVAGMARNATRGSATGCLLCGECMTGCQFEAIFSTENQIKQMIDANQITYLRATVERIARDEGEISVACIDIQFDQHFKVEAKYVFLGAGAIATGAILLKSKIVAPQVNLAETQVAYLPILAFKSRPSETSNYSLSQIFIESQDGLTSSSSFHMSLYEPSEDWGNRIKAVHPILGRLFSRLIMKHLIAGICFFPTLISGQLQLSLEEDVLVKVKEARHTSTLKISKRRLRDLRKLMLRARLFPLVEFAEFPPTGSSFHVGVLEQNKERCVSDDGLTNFGLGLYVIDGAALRALPTGPVTLSIMVNSTMIVNRVLAKQ
jgi:hypothetical protein